MAAILEQNSFKNSKKYEVHVLRKLCSSNTRVILIKATRTQRLH